MGLSQDEIDQMMDDPAGEPKKAVLESIATHFTQAIENIVPVIVSTDQMQVEADTASQGNLGDMVGVLPDDTVFFMFKLPALADGAVAGYIDRKLAIEVSSRMMGQESAEELTEALLSALNEAFNNILNAFDTALKEEFGQDVEHGDLKFLEGTPVEVLQSEAGIAPDAEVWMLPTKVTVDGVPGTLGLLVSVQCLDELVAKHPAPSEPAAAPQEEAVEGEAPSEAPEPSADLTEAQAGAPIARFEELEPRLPAGESRGIDLILDVPLSVTVELGRKTLSVKDILGLVPGSLVELEKLAGEAVDVLVNGKLFAKGEVVVIDENFGVRVSSIVTPKERIERMGE